MRPYHRMLVVAGFVAGIGGYLVAAGKNGTGQEAEISGVVSDGRSVGRDEEGRMMHPADGALRKRLTEEQLSAAKKRLWRDYLHSPSAEHDWVLRQETEKILAMFSNQELADYAREFAEQEGLLELFTVSSSDRRFMLLGEIFRQWGLRDPAAACVALSQIGTVNRSGVFEDWLKRDPEAAVKWMKEIHLPEDEYWVTSLRVPYLIHMAEKDLSAAGEELAGMGPAMKERMLWIWSGRFSDQPEKRAGLMDLMEGLGDPKIARDGRRRLLDTLASTSPVEAYDFLDGLELAAEEKSDLEEVVLGRWARMEPKEAFAAWAESGPESVPEQMCSALAIWGVDSKDGGKEAIGWLDGLEAGGVREKLKAALADGFASEQQYKQAAAVVGGMSPSIDRTRLMKTLQRQWQEAEPKAEAAWKAGLSREDRAALEAPLEGVLK